LGALLRVVFLLRDPLPSRDGLFYLDLYNHWLRTDNDAVLNPMLYYMFYFADRCGIDPMAVAVGCNIFFSIILIWVGYLIGCTLWHRASAGLIFALLLAVNYTLIRNSVEVQRESGYLLCWGLAFLGMARGSMERFASERKRLQWWMMAGIFAALAALFRYEAYEILPLCLAWLLIWRCFARWKWQTAGWCFLSFVCVWILVIGMFCLTETGIPVVKNGLLNRIIFYQKWIGF